MDKVIVFYARSSRIASTNEVCMRAARVLEIVPDADPGSVIKVPGYPKTPREMPLIPSVEDSRCFGRRVLYSSSVSAILTAYTSFQDPSCLDRMEIMHSVGPFYRTIATPCCHAIFHRHDATPRISEMCQHYYLGKLLLESGSFHVHSPTS